MTAETTPTEQDLLTPVVAGAVPQQRAAAESERRPNWVTETRLDAWREWVRADVSAVGTATQVALAPFTLRPTAEVPASTVVDVENAVLAARQAQADWARTSIKEREAVLLKFHDLVLDEQDEVLDLIQWETGKARFHAWQEIGQVTALARHYGHRSRHYLKAVKLRGMVPGATVVKEVRVPKGVVGIISPWNYPLYLGVGDVLPALAAGNAVVSKADGQTPLTLLWARDLMQRAGLPDGLWQIVTGRGSISGTALIDSVDFVAFTGSTATGKVVAAQAAGRLIGSSLELGGKNPLVVREDADLVAAARGAAGAAFANTGQMCIHIERVHVHEKVYDAFRAELVKATEEMKLGSTYDFSSDVGSLTSTDQLDTVVAHVADAVSQGARVLTGGHARPEIGPLFHELTVLEGVTPSMRVHGEETFGPVVSLYPFASDDDAVAQANQGTYGLSASVWGRNVTATEALALRIRCGAVNINDGAAAAAGSVEAGMGGMGESGLGRRHGGDGIKKYTDAQTVARQRFMPLGAPHGKPVEGFVRQTNKQLGLMKKIGLR